MSKGFRRVRLILYLVCYGIVYAGWWCHRCRQPAFLHYSLTYWMFLVGMAFPFFAPTVYGWCRRRFGAKRVRYSTLTVVLGLAVVYLMLAATYYGTREYRFDPFVQVSPPRFVPPADETVDSGYRVLALGGSTTKCVELPDEQRYPRVLEALLRERCRSSKIEVLGGAAEWYTSRHSLINYTTCYHAYRPHAVVVMHGINDLCRSFSPGEFTLGGYDSLYSHYYGPAIDGANPPTFAWQVARSHFWEPIDAWYSMLRQREVEFPVERYVSIVALRENLKALVHYAASDGCRVVLVTQPSLYKPVMTEEERAVLRFGKVFCCDERGFWSKEFASASSLERAMAEVNRVIRQMGADGLAVVADAEAEVPKDLDHFLDDVHFTERGARALAETVARTLTEAGLPGCGDGDGEKRPAPGSHVR